MKFKKLNYLLIYSIAVLFANSCNDNPVTPQNYDSYFPLFNGNEWSFQYPIWNPFSGDTLVTENYKIISTKKVNGYIYYEFNKEMPFFPGNWIIENLDTIFVRQNEKGDIMLLVDNSEWLYFTFNSSLQDSLVRMKITDMDYYFSIKAINDTVNTPVGSFYNCFKILNYFPDIIGTEHYIWFAPGYGPVKIYYPELGTTYQLVKININNN